jgi:hypothetical protein
MTWDTTFSTVLGPNMTYGPLCSPLGECSDHETEDDPRGKTHLIPAPCGLNVDFPGNASSMITSLLVEYRCNWLQDCLT